MLVFAAVMLFWHLPRFYQLALRSEGLHDVQHACFFWAGILFWIPVIEGNPRAARWFAIPYLLSADLLNTAFSALRPAALSALRDVAPGRVVTVARHLT